MEKQDKDEEVIFEPELVAEDEPVVTESQSAEDEFVFGMRRTKKIDKVTSDGSTASYYELPEKAKQLQDLISHRNMNAQIGEIFRESYRYGLSSHCDELRGARKIKFYIDAEIARLEKLL